MGMYDSFQTDPGLEREGVYLNYGEFRVKIARAGGANHKFAKILEAKSKPYRRAMENGQLSNEVGERILMEAYSEAIVLDWEVKDGDDWKQGIEAPDGSIWPVGADNIVKTFQNLPDLFADIREQSSRAALYRKSVQEAESGN